MSTIFKQLDAAGWVGLDVSLDVSLLEYGLLVRGLAGVPGAGSGYQYIYRFPVSINLDDSINFNYRFGALDDYFVRWFFKNNDWADIKHFLSYVGMSWEDYKADSVGGSVGFCNLLHGLLQYYGADDVLGCDYYGGGGFRSCLRVGGVSYV